jgi:hypothetical protein
VLPQEGRILDTGGWSDFLLDGTQTFPPTRGLMACALHRAPGLEVSAVSAGQSGLSMERLSYTAPALAPPSWWLTRCTVPGSIPNCLAMTRTPGFSRGRQGLLDDPRKPGTDSGRLGAAAAPLPIELHDGWDVEGFR